jgi:hemerythrin-like domain-containing protein
MSKAIDELKHDHDAILSSLSILDAMVGRLGTALAPAAEDFRGFIGFLKEFADKCHHGKEEGILFPALTSAGMPSQGGPVGVMLSEHVQGRRLIREMEQALSVDMNEKAFAKAARGYAELLRSHITKENEVLFPAAERLLPSGDLEVMKGKFEEHEEKVIGHGRHEELHAMLKDLKKKYLA